MDRQQFFSLANLAATGVDWISLLVTGYQDTITSTTIFTYCYADRCRLGSRHYRGPQSGTEGDAQTSRGLS
jgi:hypothetical protein